MARLINSDDLINEIVANCCRPCELNGEDYHGIKCRACLVDDCIEYINNAPIVNREDLIPVINAIAENIPILVNTIVKNMPTIVNAAIENINQANPSEDCGEWLNVTPANYFTPGGEPVVICPFCNDPLSRHVQGFENGSWNYCNMCGKRLK